ncbi:MAG: hypothetical protein ABSC23_21970 [Bryobacteraceae bacterium]|jgi:hypothetical protein
MTDERDELVDRAIEAEKLSALQRYRLHPVSLRPTVPVESAVSWRAGWTPLGRNTLARACAALLVVSLLVIMRDERQSSTLGVTRQTIERALSAANAARQEAAPGGDPSSGVHDAGSDTAWTTQRAFYRTQLHRYSAQGWGVAVLRTFSKLQALSKTE